MSTRLTSSLKLAWRALSTRITSGISMPTSTPSTNTSAYSALRKGADIHAKSRNSSVADSPPSSPTSSSMSMKRASTSRSSTYFERCEPTPIANR